MLECGINTSTQKVSNQLKNCCLSSEDTLISFDVTSLYTNVPVKESIEICADLLFKRIDFKSLDKETFIVLAELACCNVIFSTHQGYYIQKDGLAMGSPPAPHLANGWLSQFDNVIRDNSVLYERYMDDVLTVVRKDRVNERLTHINNLHPYLHFTHELEDEGSIAFLDMLIKNQNGNLSSSWYRKPTDTGLTLNYHALAPLKYKKSVVSSFIYRIYRASSNWKNFHDGLNSAIETLYNNQYPDSFIMPIIKRVIEKLVCPDDENDEMNDSVNESVTESICESVDSNAYVIDMAEKDKFMFFITYRGKPTEQLAKSFKKLNAPCRIIMKTKKTKNALPSLKTMVPKMLQSSVVYKISCPGCNSSYVGQTIRHVQRRYQEHIGNNGLIKKHCESCDNSDLCTDNISILAHSKIYFKLLTLEALFIEKLKPKLNTKDEYRSRTLTIKF